MTRIVTTLAATLLLAACGSDPEVEVRDANVAEVAEAVREARGGRDQTFQVRPGQWESKVTILEIDIPGMPAGMQDQMKAMFARNQPSAFTSCLTPAEAKKPKEDFFAGAGNNCRYDHFRMGGGKIDARMRCTQGEGVQLMAMAGTYSPDSYAMTVTTDRSGGEGPGGKARMTMRMDSRRVGECGKQADPAATAAD